MGKGAKRKLEEGDDDGGYKRRRLREEAKAFRKADWKEPKAVKDLYDLLFFQQDNNYMLRERIRSFRVLLEKIADPEEAEAAEGRQALVLSYLESSMNSKDEFAESNSSLFQIWSFASSVVDENLYALTAKVLGILLDLGSSRIEFVRVSSALCRTVLKADNMEICARALHQKVQRAHMIKPVLRLLTLIMAFDGGAFASTLYTQRDVVLRRFDALLSTRASLSRDPEARRRERPTVRQHALWYLMAALRFQSTAAKEDILSQARITRATFQTVTEDKPASLRELLEEVRQTVISDQALSREAKGKFLCEPTLERIMALYGYPEEFEDVGSSITVPEAAHSFLLSACTSAGQGILLKEDGWYPPGTKTAPSRRVRGDSRWEGKSQDVTQKYSNKVPVRNTMLAAILQQLRTHANPLQRELAIAIFRQAPELVADYFLRKRNFTFEPKVTATWIGYATFIFSVIRLPLPRDHGLAVAEVVVPPPVEVVIESILPQPLTQQSLTKCLHNHSTLVKYTATKLLVVAFQKLKEVRKYFGRHRSSVEWKEAEQSLLANFSQRCPEIRHVIQEFQSCKGNRPVSRLSLLQLLSLYFSETPSLAVDAKLDISSMISEALEKQESYHDEDGLDFRAVELSYYLQIACRSSDMQWWKKSDSAKLSPYTTILRNHMSSRSAKNELTGILLRSVAVEHHAVQREISVSSFHALESSLEEKEGWVPAAATYEFLDNCLTRLARRPLKYSGDVHDFRRPETTDDPVISLLIIVTLEQWPFFVERHSSSDQQNCARWILQLVAALKEAGEDEQILSTVQEELKNSSRNQPEILSIFSQNLDDMSIVSTHERADIGSNSHSGLNGVDPQTQSPELDGMILQLETSLRIAPEDPNHAALIRWQRLDPKEVIEDGVLATLISYLSSPHSSIRRQTLVALRSFMAKIQQASGKEEEQAYLLLGELIETATSSSSWSIDDKPLPGFAVAFAARALRVLGNPLHYMFGKVNQFLNKAPAWHVERMPWLWIEKVLLQPPEAEGSGAHWREVGWFMELLIDGLRDKDDMNIYRRCAVFERVLSACSAATMPPWCFGKIVNLLYRAMLVGGSATLVTRCGMVTWLQCQLGTRGKGGAEEAASIDRTKLSCLVRKLHSECKEDQRVGEWSGGIERFNETMKKLA